MFSLRALNAPRAYYELIQTLRIAGVPQNSRAGEVYAMTEPFGLTITSPQERVIFDVDRDANPFFHLMEAIWMFAGENDVGWLLQFNSGFGRFAESDGTMRGAYGHRWRYHFGFDQIKHAVKELKADPNTRRVVVGMWDPGYDTDSGHKDYPCNTHLYFRVVDNRLDMTVCNRSNDLIWGMMGSNIVHMTMLQEVMAAAAGYELGQYHVLTNNLHIYHNVPNFERIWQTWGHNDPYGTLDVVDILPDGNLELFLSECFCFVHGFFESITNPFLRNVALPMFNAYQSRKQKLSDGLIHLKRMPANNDWRKAAEEWIQRREISSSSTSTEPSPMMSQEPRNTLEDQQESSGQSTLPPPLTTSPSTKLSSLSDSSDTTEEKLSGLSPDDLIPF